MCLKCDYIPCQCPPAKKASPALLAACKAAEKLLLALGDPFDGDQWQAMQTIRAAIALAEPVETRS